jgi:redox-sensitive bicupin YhaK (pirin superfamily)
LPGPSTGFKHCSEDSPGDLRSRVSSSTDLTVGAGGIVWTRAGSGVVHEEVPAVPGRELHGLQIFLILSGAEPMPLRRTDSSFDYALRIG